MGPSSRVQSDRRDPSSASRRPAVTVARMRYVKNVVTDMPHIFGPLTLPPVTSIDRQSTVVISFTTTRNAVRDLLPRHFLPAEEPLVSFTHQALDGIDYMQGRGYNLLNVAVTAVFNGTSGPMVRPFPVVIWENNTMPIIAGRELAGNPKIFGEVSGLAEEGTSVSFDVKEYGSNLVSARVDNLQSLKEDRLERVNRAAIDSSLFGWKFVPGCAGVDADYPTLIHGSSTFERGWTGDAILDISSPTVTEAPFSARIVEVLRDLPRLQLRPAFFGTGSAKLFRDRTERLR